MRVLIFTNTPAHVHTYRNAIDRLVERGHEVLVLAREYGCTTDLLDFFGITYRVYGSHEATAYSRLEFASELTGQLAAIALEARRFRPDVLFGRGPYAAFSGVVTAAPTVLILDDEPGDFNHTVSRPFADAIITPHVTRRDLGSNHYTFDGFKECAYLHPEVYEPIPDIRDRLGVADDEQYAIARFNAFDALHDVGAVGFSLSQRRDLLESLAEEATVFVSDEAGTMDFRDLPAREYDLHPALLHDAIREAHLLVADTGTIVTEAGLLGTPAIRYGGTEDREFGEFAALEDAGLIEDCDRYERVKARSLEILQDKRIRTRRRERRDAYVSGLVNLTDLIVDVAEARGDVDRVVSRTGGRAQATRVPNQ
ncbi:hypothetical protein HALLA_11155 [Halostagnicola larsenii XH-48]|uniref:DUF354 domain-containing protein n=1 Tax=Halostagnicola larsenii XH-48 TaxID=797299 RepID=W0JPZ5_9EURY|nr:DUF354 domain-containing protein [Halostagnicola larsenii]AHF99336.1 hypothetical protein HALLA_11155 [Halostagnicola larsenii XH-48]